MGKALCRADEDLDDRWLAESTLADRIRPARRSGLGGDAQDDVDLRGQLAGAEAGDRDEFGRDRIAGLRVAEAPVDPVALIRRVALDVELGRQQLLAVLAELDVDVRA